METYFDNIKNKLLVESAIPDIFMIMNEDEKPSVLGTAGTAVGIGAGLTGLGALGYHAATAAEGANDIGTILSNSWDTFKDIVNPMKWGQWIKDHLDFTKLSPETQNYLTQAKDFITNPTTIGIGTAGAVIAGLYLLKKKQYDKKKDLDMQTLARAQALAKLPPQQAQQILNNIKR